MRQESLTALERRIGRRWWCSCRCRWRRCECFHKVLQSLANCVSWLAGEYLCCLRSCCGDVCIEVEQGNIGLVGCLSKAAAQKQKASCKSPHHQFGIASIFSRFDEQDLNFALVLLRGKREQVVLWGLGEARSQIPQRWWNLIPSLLRTNSARETDRQTHSYCSGFLDK